MADTKQAIKQYIANGRRQGKSDGTILAEMARDEGEIGNNIARFNHVAKFKGLNPTAELAKYFGLNIKAGSTAVEGRKISKAQSLAESVNFAVVNATDDLAQASYWASDKLNTGFNKLLGTNLPTNQYEQGKKKYQQIKNLTLDGKRGSGRGRGTDWMAAGTEAVATIPLFMLGGGAGNTIKSTLAFGGRQAGIGAGVGAARHSDSTEEKLANMGMGAVGAAVGGVMGEKVLAPAINKAGRSIVSKIPKKVKPNANTANQAKKMVDEAIEGAIAKKGMVINPATRKKMINQTSNHLARGNKPDVVAMARKELLDRYNIKGTQAQISRDPTTWAAEREAAKQSDALNTVHINNHQQLDELMQRMIDDTGASNINTRGKMESQFKVLRNNNTEARANISQMYKDAGKLEGAKVKIPSKSLTSEITNKLTANGRGEFAPRFNNIIKANLDEAGNLDLTKIQGLRASLNKVIAKPTNQAESWAAGQAKRIIDDMVESAVENQPSLSPAAQAYRKVTGEYRNYAQTLDKTPALKAAINEVEPDKAFNKYVLNANAGDIVRLVDNLKTTPAGQQSIKDMQGAVIEHFLKSATKSNNGAFSPAQLNRVVKSFGDDRLKALFSKEQIATLNDIRHVADILVQQPLGAHVNHSNTANVLIKQLLGVANMAGKVPAFGNAILGGIDYAGKMAKSGQGTKMINGQVPVSKVNASLGLSPEQVIKLKRLARGASVTSSSVGANIGAGNN